MAVGVEVGAHTVGVGGESSAFIPALSPTMTFRMYLVKCEKKSRWKTQYPPVRRRGGRVRRGGRNSSHLAGVLSAISLEDSS